MGAISPNAGIESWVLFPQNTRIGRYLPRVPLWDCSTPILPESPNKFGVFAWVQKVSKAHLPRRCWLPNFLWQIYAKSVTLGFDFETGGTDPDSNPSHQALTSELVWRILTQIRHTQFWLQNLCDGSWLKSVTPSLDFRTCVTDPDSNPSHQVLTSELVWRILTQIRHTQFCFHNLCDGSWLKSVTPSFDFRTCVTDPDSNPSHQVLTSELVWRILTQIRHTQFCFHNLCDGSWLKSVTPSFDFRTCVTDPDSNPSHQVLTSELVWRILTQIRHTSLFCQKFQGHKSRSRDKVPFVTDPRSDQSQIMIDKLRGQTQQKKWESVRWTSPIICDWSDLGSVTNSKVGSAYWLWRFPRAKVKLVTWTGYKYLQIFDSQGWLFCNG